MICLSKIKQITIGGFLTMFLSCSKLPHPMSEDLVGQWKSDMNEVLILYANSTFEAKGIVLSNYKAKLLFNDSSETKIGGKGTWKIYKTDNENKLCLNYLSFVKKHETIEKQFGFTWSIKGSGLFENRLPWKIVSWIGDDEGISTFKKVK